MSATKRAVFAWPFLHDRELHEACLRSGAIVRGTLHAGIRVAETAEFFRKTREEEAAVANGEHKWLSYAGDGIAAGLGVLFAQITTSSALRIPPLYPLAAAASTLLGRGALVQPSGLTLLLGMGLYLLSSVALGIVYHLPKTTTLLSACLLTRGKLRPAVSGAVYGIAVWLIIVTIGRPLYPWLADAPLLFSWWMLAVFYGIPLGVLAARTEQKRPVELKIIYSSSLADRPLPRSTPPKQVAKPMKSRAPGRPGSKGLRRPSQNAGRLRLLSKSSQREEGDDPQR
jgi:hypothetical protein